MKKKDLYENVIIKGESEFSFTCEFEKLNENDVNRYHVDIAGFKQEGIRRFVDFLRTHIGRVRKSQHTKSRCKERDIPLISVERILRSGKVFEYKTCKKTNALWRLAVRVNGKHGYDYIYVLAPIYDASRNAFNVNYVTAYKNRRGDKHASLKEHKYAQV